MELLGGVVPPFNVQQKGLEEGDGAVFKEYRLISVKLHPIGDGASVEGDDLLTAILVKDEEIISESTILLGEGEGHSVLDFVKEEGENAHNLGLFGFTIYIAKPVPNSPGVHKSWLAVKILKII